MWQGRSVTSSGKDYEMLIWKDETAGVDPGRRRRRRTTMTTRGIGLLS